MVANALDHQKIKFISWQHFHNLFEQWLTDYIF